MILRKAEIHFTKENKSFLLTYHFRHRFITPENKCTNELIDLHHLHSGSSFFPAESWILHDNILSQKPEPNLPGCWMLGNKQFSCKLAWQGTGSCPARSYQHGSSFSTERDFVTLCSSYFWARKSPRSGSSFHNSHLSLLIISFITFWSIWILIQSMFIYLFLSPRKCTHVDDLRLSYFPCTFC